ncbi:hypothetical protein [Sphingomonas sp. ID0503]|uniref:hypothetical protein n=1 Tax=Sphingomonas sp. ID0503 TaxID=3399691 RepID=UPI003AFB6CDE
MQRVRIGLTGLAIVFLLVVLAAAVINALGEDEDGNNAANAAAVSDPKEPLAELGIAPGNAPPEPAKPAAPTGK